MYHETTRETILKLFRLPESFVPETCIALGQIPRQKLWARWRSMFDEVIEQPVWENALFGRLRGKPVVFINVYGATMAADFVRCPQVLGARQVIQIGYYGGLQHHMNTGDFLVGTHAVRLDGASDFYLPRDVALPATEALNTRLIAGVRAQDEDAIIHQAPILSTGGGILSETKAQIDSWCALGIGGVDLETAATFAVAHRFGMACAALLVCSDVVVAGDSLLDHDGRDEARARYHRAALVMEEAVLGVVGE